MNSRKKDQLRKAGWQVGSAAEFLDLTADEAEYVETKAALAVFLRKYRVKKRLTQVQLATRIASSQSRVAKMEAADTSVSIDHIMRTLYKLGASSKEVARAIGAAKA